MPNGGSDCCESCWFNSNNEDEAGYHGSKIEGVVRCIIRDIEIPDPVWTYCSNHPHHNRNKIDVPLGPVYVDDYPNSRKVWLQPPDNENIRLKLLEILDEISSQERNPSDDDIDLEVIKHIAALREKRAVPMLLRISQLLDIENYKKSVPPIIVGQAIESLLEISEGKYLDDVKKFIQAGVVVERYDQKTDNFVMIRYHLIRGLQYCPQSEADDLLQIGTHDPNNGIKAFAVEILKKRNYSNPIQVV